MKAKTFAIISLIAVLALTLSRPATASVGAGQMPVEPAAPLARSAGEGPGVRASPVMFIQNVGQFADGARFQVRGGDRTIWLAEDGVWVTVVETPPQPSPTSGRKFRPAPLSAAERGEGPGVRGEVRAVNIKLSFPGANPYPRLEPFHRLDTVVSYFIGNDPAKWHVAVPVWGGVRYKDLYPGIDLEITGENGRLVQRLVARLGADLSAVRLRVEGADAVELAGGEGLHLTTTVGDFTLSLLTVEGATPDGQPTTLNLKPETFDIASPFSPAPLLPSTSAQSSELLYATFLGGSESDYVYSIAVDSSGAAYLTGSTYSSGFPTTPGVFDPTFNGSDDAFVAKLNAAGSALLYATFLGGGGSDGGHSIAVDGSDAAYVAGHTFSYDFPTTPGAFDPTYNGGWDAFVVKLNAVGNALLYATLLGGSSWEYGIIAVDASGAAYLTGETGSSDFPTTPGAFDPTYNGNGDAFVVKLNAAGSALLYATFLGGSGSDFGEGIAVDASGAAYVTGYTFSSNFPTTPSAFDPTFNGSQDAFVAKLNVAGSALLYATFLGGSSNEKGLGITVDSSGAAHVTGFTRSSDFPTTPGAYDTTFNGYDDAFVVKLNPSGTALAYATFLGGNSDDWGEGIAVDANGVAYVTGGTLSSDFPTTPGAFDTTHNGDEDAFVVKLNPSGAGSADLAYATFLGGSGGDGSSGIAVDGSGNVYVTGGTESFDFPTTLGAYDSTFNGKGDVFVAKLGVGGGVGPTPTGSLTLLAAPTIPTTQPLAATAQVRNTGASLRDFTLTLRLQQGSATLDTRTFTLSLAGGGTAERTADFGLRPAGRYRIEATLLAGGTTLATQSRDVTVTDPNAARIILDYAGDLKAAAQAELDDIAYIPSYALADEILDFGLDNWTLD